MASDLIELAARCEEMAGLLEAEAGNDLLNKERMQFWFEGREQVKSKFVSSALDELDLADRLRARAAALRAQAGDSSNDD